MNIKIGQKFGETANKKFNEAFAKLALAQPKDVTDPETPVQQLWDLVWQNLLGADTIRIGKCDTYFENGVIKGYDRDISFAGLCEYKADIDMESREDVSDVASQMVIYYKGQIGNPNRRTPEIGFIADKDELIFFPMGVLNKFLNIPGVNYNCAASSAYKQAPLKQAIMADDEFHNSYIPFHPATDVFTHISAKISAIMSGHDYKLPVNDEGAMRKGFDSFSDCVEDLDEASSNELVSIFLDVIRYPEKTSYYNGLLAAPGHTAIHVNSKMERFMAYFGKPTSEEDSRNLTRLYDLFVSEMDRRKHGFFITPSVWSDLAHGYMARILGDNWEADPNIMVWDCCAGTKSLERDHRWANLWLSTIDEGEFTATKELCPEAKGTFVFDFLNDPLTKLPKQMYDELMDLHRHPEKKLALLDNPPYGQAKGDSDRGSVEKGATVSMIQEEMNRSGLGVKCSDMFIAFLYRMAQLESYFKLRPGQLVIGTFNKPTWMSGTGSTKFLNWFLDRMEFKDGFLFNAKEFKGCSSTWGIAFSMFVNSHAKGDRTTFRHEIYENMDGCAKSKGTMCFVNPDKMQRMDVWWKLDNALERGSGRIVAATDGYLGVVSTKQQKYNGGKKRLSIAYCKSYGNIAQNKYSCMSTIPADDNNTNVVTEENIDKACVAYCCRNLTHGNWINDKDNYYAPSAEVEASEAYGEWMRDCRIMACFSYQTSISGTTPDGESYDYHNAFCPFKKSEVLSIRNDFLRKNESEEVPYAVTSGFFNNMSDEAKNVISSYKALLLALELHRAKVSREHPELHLDRWDAGWVQYRGYDKKKNRPQFWFAETYAKKEYMDFTKALKVLGDKIRPGIYEFGFLKK